MELIQKLKETKTTSEKKKLYNLIVWILENKEADLQKVQNRINSTHYSYQGYFKKTYHEKTEEEKREYIKRASTYVSTNKNVLEKQRIRQQNMRAINKMYVEGKLSKESSDLIKKIYK